jgi:hypothetical protein
MVPFATFLDRVGVISQNSKDGMMLGRILSRSVGDDPHQVYQNPGMLYQPSPQKPAILYLEESLSAASAESAANFQRRLNLYRHEGFEVVGLDSRWNFIAEVPFLLYPLDAYPAFAFTHTNPLLRNPFEPPRRTLDGNLYLRLPKGGIALRFGLFDKARSLSGLFESLVKEKLGEGFVLASPSVEAIPTAEINGGTAGVRLDGHDRITMVKNRINSWGQVNLPTRNWRGQHVGITFSGPLPALMHFVEPKP